MTVSIPEPDQPDPSLTPEELEITIPPEGDIPESDDGMEEEV